MSSISITKSQENLNYAIYMIGGSYFEKASCSNTRLETIIINWKRIRKRICQKSSRIRQKNMILK